MYKRQVPPQDVITRDNVTVKVNAVVFWRVIDPQRAVLEAVSYTHLRAHETVLDLVCRLLLEKKKTNITE